MNEAEQKFLRTVYQLLAKNKSTFCVSKIFNALKDTFESGAQDEDKLQASQIVYSKLKYLSHNEKDDLKKLSETFEELKTEYDIKAEKNIDPEKCMIFTMEI